MAPPPKPWAPTQIVWSALLGIAIWSAVGFSWFGHGFDWTTQRGAREMAANALKEYQADLCVAQARGAPDSADAVKKLAGMSLWKRREFVETARWATMPGSDKPTSGVADLCATKLIET